MKKGIFILGFCIAFFSCKNEKTKDIPDEKDTLSLAYNVEPVNGAKLYGGQLMRIDSFPSKYITPRPVDVWLPKGYTEDKTYAVLYMHDGQMLFDSTATWNKQEWKVDEWASRLMDETKTKDFIVVAVHNIAKIRWQDLFPQKAFDYIDDTVKDSLVDIAGKGNIKLNGDNYLKCIVKEIKPFIDKKYAVLTDPSNTYVMGSSMGGLMSMYAISEYPDVFGGAGCLSTHWVGARPVDDNPYPEAIFKYMSDNFPKAGNHKVYFDYGNKTLDQYYPQYAPRVDAILKEKGFTDVNSKNLFFEDTEHSENSWNQRLDQPLQFLLGKD
ncbi:alpha/beta hydrolase [Winogradskyella sp.]|uniref:alpha/beta hydrolase n=1 Tax=Winogradskyella sp. TaxID=1883156 RepID=UPI003BAA73B7